MEAYYLDRKIADTTLEHLGDLATEADLHAYKAACRNYQAEHSCTDQEAMDAIWDNGDVYPQIARWAPDEAE